MMSSRLTLSPQHRSQLENAARGAHPEECCGFLLGRADSDVETVVERVVPACNVSSADRRREYLIHPLALLETWKQARAEGRDLVGFYHSHPDGNAGLSRRDKRSAWADVSYLIVPWRGRMTSWRRQAQDGFAAETIVEQPAGGSAR